MEFVDSAMEGKNVTVLSYGRMGSGKTHTMHGPGNLVGVGDLSAPGASRDEYQHGITARAL